MMHQFNGMVPIAPSELVYNDLWRFSGLGFVSSLCALPARMSQ
jgi:hypothetical protein